MNKSTLIADIMTRIEASISSSTGSRTAAIKYIDVDWGQLNSEQPAVGYPCVLISVDECTYRHIKGGGCHALAGVVVTVVGKRAGASSSHAPSARKAAATATIDLSDAVEDLLDDWCASNAEYTSLEELGMIKLNDIPGLEIYQQRYRTTW